MFEAVLSAIVRALLVISMLTATYWLVLQAWRNRDLLEKLRARADFWVLLLVFAHLIGIFGFSMFGIFFGQYLDEAKADIISTLVLGAVLVISCGLAILAVAISDLDFAVKLFLGIFSIVFILFCNSVGLIFLGEFMRALDP